MCVPEAGQVRSPAPLYSLAWAAIASSEPSWLSVFFCLCTAEVDSWLTTLEGTVRICHGSTVRTGYI